MPSKRKAAGPAAEAPELKVPKELLDELVKGPMTQGDLETMFRSLKKAVIERAMTAEMTQHLGYEPASRAPRAAHSKMTAAYDMSAPIRFCAGSVFARRQQILPESSR